MKLVNYQQRSEEWHRWRSKGISASEVATILGHNPNKTPWRLWAEKVGKVPREDLSKNPNVIRGIEKEDLARQVAEDLLGDILLPICAEYDEEDIFRASLDGVTEKNEPTELKCPARSTFDDAQKNGEQSKAYQLYYPQVQQQMLVTGGKQGYLLLYYDEDGEKEHILFTIPRDEQLIEEILAKGRKYWKMVVEGKEPTKDPLRDVLVPEWDARSTWMTLAGERRRMAKFLEEQEAQVKRIKGMLKENEKAMIEIMGDFMRAESDGVAITRYAMQGKVNYKQLLEDMLPDLDEDTLDKYRGKTSERVRVTLTNTDDAEAKAKAAKERRKDGDDGDKGEDQEQSVYAW